MAGPFSEAMGRCLRSHRTAGGAYNFLVSMTPNPFMDLTGITAGHLLPVAALSPFHLVREDDSGRSLTVSKIYNGPDGLPIGAALTTALRVVSRVFVAY